MNNQSRELENEVRRLHSLMRLAAEEAVLQNEELGFYVDNQGYEFLQYQDADDTWVAAQGESLRARELPEWMTIELSREDQARSLPVKEDNQDKQPLLLLLSSGESTAFKLTFFIDNEESRAFVIESDGLGEIKLTNPEAPENE
jgi:general secretion pathway protein H